MRPDILNPLFAEVTALKGVGPGLAKPLDKLGLHRVVDVAFHLPPGSSTACRATNSTWRDAGRTIAITLTPVEYKSSASQRGPTRVHAIDAKGNYVSLIYFGGSSGWVKKLLPLERAEARVGQARNVWAGTADHPSRPRRRRRGISRARGDLSAVGGDDLARLGQFAHEAVERAPDLPEWIEPGLKAQHDWPDWRDALARAHADPADAKARERLAYDELFANQLAFMLVRASSRARRGRALAGDGRLRDMLKLP